MRDSAAAAILKWRGWELVPWLTHVEMLPRMRLFLTQIQTLDNVIFDMYLENSLKVNNLSLIKSTLFDVDTCIFWRMSWFVVWPLNLYAMIMFSGLEVHSGLPILPSSLTKLTNNWFTYKRRIPQNKTFINDKTHALTISSRYDMISVCLCRYFLVLW